MMTRYMILVTAIFFVSFFLSACQRSNRDLNEITIHFNPQGGTSVSTITLIESNPIPAPAEPLKDGYHFIGWSLTPSGAPLRSIKDVFEQDQEIVTLHAIWERQYRYTNIKYQIENEVIKEARVREDESIIFPAVPEKELHEFIGWFTDEEGNEPFDASMPYVENLTLFGLYNRVYRFTNIKYQIEDEVVKEARVREDESIIFPAVPEKELHEFIGWFTDEEGNEPFDASMPYVENLTLYGVYQRLPDVFIEVLEIQLPKNNLVVNDTFDLKVTFSPNDVTNSEIIFSSSDQSIASIEDNVLTVHQTGEVIISAQAKKGNAINQWVLTIENYGIFSQEDFDKYTLLEVRPDKVLLMTSLDSLTLTKGVIFDFNGNTLNELSIISSDHHSTTLIGEGLIQGNLTIDAPNMLVENLVPVEGTTTIHSVSKNSYHSNVKHTGLIRILGSAHLMLTEDASYSTLNIQTNQDVILSGSYHGSVTVQSEMNYLSINGFIDKLYINQDVILHLREGSELVELISHTANVRVLREEGVLLPSNLPHHINIVQVYRVYIHHHSNVGPFGYHIVESQSRVTFIETQPTREGHDFLGWYRDAEFQQLYSFSELVSENLNLYARWRVHQFFVHFRGDMIQEPSLVVDYNQRVSLPSTPVREGHRFKGWFLDEELVTPFSTRTQIKSNLTLYGGWDRLSYSVSFQGLPSESQSVLHGDFVNMPGNPSKEGHTFNGWFKDDQFEEAFNVWAPITESITIYPKFTINQYAIDFVTIVSNLKVDRQYIDFNHYASEPNVEKPFYLLEGWYVDADFTERFSFLTKIDTSFTLYAKWVENPNLNEYPVYFMNLSWDPMIVSKGALLNLEDPLLHGHQFTGWFLDEAFIIPWNENDPVEGIIRLYAHFEPISYLLSFDTKTQQHFVEPQLVTYGALVALPELSKAGYRFIGWSNEDNLWNVSSDTMPAQPVTLTAIWEAYGDNVFVLEKASIETTTLTLELWIRGNVLLNSYNLRIHYESLILDYVSNQNHLGSTINPSQQGVIFVNYSNVQSTIDQDTKLVTVVFNILNVDATKVRIELIEAYRLDDRYQIIPIEYDVVDLIVGP